MANQRHPDQTLIAVAMNRLLRSQIAVAKKKTGHDQSTFIRQAIVEKLQSMEVPVDPEWAFAPDRSKPFEQPTKYPDYQPAAASINDQPIDGRKDAKLKSAGTRILGKLKKA